MSSSHALPTSPTRVTLRDFLCKALTAAALHEATVLVQGVQPPLEINMEALYAHMHGPDGFLHVCARLGATA